MIGKRVTLQIWVGAGALLTGTTVCQPQAVLTTKTSALTLITADLICPLSIMDWTTLGVLQALRHSTSTPASSPRGVAPAVGVVPGMSALG